MLSFSRNEEKKISLYETNKMIERICSTGKTDNILKAFATCYMMVLLQASLDIIVTSSPTAIFICQFSSRTYLWNVQTFRLVPNNSNIIQEFLTSVPLVLAGLVHLACQIIFGPVSGFQEILLAGRTAVHFRLADITDVMSICTQYDRRRHVLHTHRKLQVI